MKIDRKPVRTAVTVGKARALTKGADGTTFEPLIGGMYTVGG